MQIISSRCIIRPFQSHEIDSFMVYRNDAEWMKYQGFKGLTKEDYEAELLGVLTLARGIQLAIVNKMTQVLIGDIYLRQQCDVFGSAIPSVPLMLARDMQLKQLPPRLTG